MKKERKKIFVKILDDFHDFVPECVSFPRKINNPWEVTVFPMKSAIFIGRETKNTHVTDENQRNKIAKVSPSNNNYSFIIKKPFNNNNNKAV